VITAILYGSRLIAALVPSIAGIGVPWATKSTSGKVRDGMLIATAALKVSCKLSASSEARNSSSPARNPAYAWRSLTEPSRVPNGPGPIPDTLAATALRRHPAHQAA